MHGANVRGGSFHSGSDGRLERLQRLAPRLARYFQRLEPHLVIVSRERHQRGIAFTTDDVDDRLTGRAHDVVGLRDSVDEP